MVPGCRTVGRTPCTVQHGVRDVHHATSWQHGKRESPAVAVQPSGSNTERRGIPALHRAQPPPPLRRSGLVRCVAKCGGRTLLALAPSLRGVRCPWPRCIRVEPLCAPSSASRMECEHDSQPGECVGRRGRLVAITRARACALCGIPCSEHVNLKLQPIRTISLALTVQECTLQLCARLNLNDVHQGVRAPRRYQHGGWRRGAVIVIQSGAACWLFALPVHICLCASPPESARTHRRTSLRASPSRSLGTGGCAIQSESHERLKGSHIIGRPPL